MITYSKVNTIERSGVQSENNFQIKANGQAFKILSDGLYSDKITAVIRELSCNAYDAHVDGKNLDTPFTVQLPNKLEPTFKIRDFGIGLSAHDVQHVYTTYFESTKTESNDVIGCLGLGSKSPFSYTDSFSVISFYNGTKYLFNAFLNEDGTPTIAKLAEIDTDEPNGIEVSFPVKSCDFWEFEEKASMVFKHFKLRPTITGAEVNIPKVSYFMEGHGWGLRTDKINGATAIMGNVSYPMTGINSELSNTQRQLLNVVPIDINFKIGELEVSASRESLSYNKATLDSIKSRLDIITKDIESDVAKKISDAPNLWEARIMAYKLIQGEYSTIKGLLGKSPFEWGGQPLTVGYIQNKVVGLGISRFYFKSRSRRIYTYSKSTISKDMVSAIQATDEVCFFWNDLNTGSHARCKQVLNKDNHDKEGNAIIKAVYLLNGTASMIKELQDDLGLSTAIPAISTIIRDKVTRASFAGIGDVNPLNSSKLLVFDETDGQRDSATTYWRKDKLRVNNGGIYVLINRYRINDEMPHIYMNRIADTLNLIGEDFEDIEVIGAKFAMGDKLSGLGNWIHLEDYVKEKVLTYLKDNDMSKRIALRKEIRDLNRDRDIDYRLLNFLKELAVSEFSEVPEDSPVKEFFSAIENMNHEIGDADSLDSYVRLADVYDVYDNSESLETVGLLDKWEVIKAKYPLIFALDSWKLNSNLPAIQDYIKMKDMNIKLEQELEAPSA